MSTEQHVPQSGTPAHDVPAAAADSGQQQQPGVDFIYTPHPHIARRKREGPVKIADQLPAQNPVVRFNSRLALLITICVGSMWCAYLFMVLALVSFPAALQSGNTIILVAWISQTFCQLVLLPIIIVGQNLQGQAVDKRAEQTYNDAEAVLHEALQIQQHLTAQDRHLQQQDKRLRGIMDALLRAYPAATEATSAPD
jgi:hypothetical protein